MSKEIPEALEKRVEELQQRYEEWLHSGADFPIIPAGAIKGRLQHIYDYVNCLESTDDIRLPVSVAWLAEQIIGAMCEHYLTHKIDLNHDKH